VATPFGLASEATAPGVLAAFLGFNRVHSCAFAVQFVSIRGYFGGLAPDAFISL